MSAPQNVVADLAAFAERGQSAASDVFESWTSTVATIGDAAGTQASSLRRLVRGMFDIADQVVAVERELATFLTVNAQVSAAALDGRAGISRNDASREDPNMADADVLPQDIETFILTHVQPKVRVDGGYISVESVREDEVVLLAQADCARCPASGGCQQWWIQGALKKAFGRDIRVVIRRDIPYYAR